MASSDAHETIDVGGSHRGPVEPAKFRPGLESLLEPRQGDVVRFEVAETGLWFYCRVDESLDGDEFLCTVVDAQSWPDLMLAGRWPGRQYRMRASDALSIVRSGRRGG